MIDVRVHIKVEILAYGIVIQDAHDIITQIWTQELARAIAFQLQLARASRVPIEPNEGGRTRA